jgi:hypothetical protein
MPGLWRGKPSRGFFFLTAMLLCLLFRAVLCSAAEDEERVLLGIWTQHNAAPSNHAFIVDECAHFQAGHAASDFLPLVRGLAAWHQLAAGDWDAARTNLLRMLSDGSAPLAKASQRMALRWLTRLDREKVKAALAAHYAQNVAFPDALAALARLPAAERPPLADRFSQPWQYSLTGFKHLRGTKAQRYTLASTELRDSSDLRLALARPYAADIRPTPLRLVSGERGSAIFVFETGGPQSGKATVAEGVAIDDTTVFVKQARTFLVLSDGDYWRIVPWPPRTAQP